MLAKINDIVTGQPTIGLLWCGDSIVFKSFVETKDKSFCTQYYLGESYVHQGPCSLTQDGMWTKLFLFCYPENSFQFESVSWVQESVTICVICQKVNFSNNSSNA